MIYSAEFVLIALLAGHAIGDYAFQSEFMTRAKSRHDPVKGVPWSIVMLCHCIIHAALVAFATGIWWLFIPEFVIHWITDDRKCTGKLSFAQDQAIHLACKLVWWALWLALFL